MSQGEVTLTYGDLAITLKPEVGSDRTRVNQITLGEESLLGVSTVEGRAIGHSLFTWRWKFHGTEELIQNLEEMRDLQQEDLKARNPNPYITQIDEVYQVNPTAASKPNRSSYSSLGGTNVYCAFAQCLIVIPENSYQLIRKELDSDYSLYESTVMIREVYGV